MKIMRIEEPSQVENLLKDWDESLIWSCLDKTMGYLYAPESETKESVMAMQGDFSFYAGKPLKELVQFKPEECKQEFIIMVPQNEEWGKLIEEVYQGKAEKITRYAIKKEGDVFNREKLQQVVDSLSSEYEMKQLDQAAFDYAKSYDWTCDWCSQFPDYDTYHRLGLGYIIWKDGEVVAGASSYTRYQGGIEIEIDTKEEYRRKGLAYCCAAKLILECLNRGWYPSWDASNRWSVGLAEKLGYHFSHEYTAYIVRGY